jgi:hypothetical protein
VVAAIGSGFFGELQAAIARVRIAIPESWTRRVVEALMGFLP